MRTPHPVLTEGGYSAPQVCELVGITYRMLDYWIRIGLVTPSVPATGSGSRRRFSPADVYRVRRIKLASEMRSGSLVEALERLDDLEAMLDDLKAIPA